jgi:hypothetical protein
MRCIPALLALLALGCVARPVDLEPGDEEDELMDALGPRVLILSNPQDSLVGMLGAVIDPGTGVPIPTRRFVIPASTHSLDLVRYSGVREMSVASGVATDFFGGVSDAEVSHVSYDVNIYDSYYLVGVQPYDESSRCCEPDGALDPSCRSGYVTRVFVGSGTLRYLSERSTDVDLGVGDVEVHGGRTYRVARERRFTSAAFAVEIGPAAEVCERAFCDEREESGACGACSVRGASAALPSMTAPAEGMLGVLCEGMRANAEAVVTVRGDVTVEDCAEEASVTLDLFTDGAQSSTVTLSSTDAARSPLTFLRRTDPIRASAAGILFAELDLVACRCGDASARCSLDAGVVLAIGAIPR